MPCEGIIIIIIIIIITTTTTTTTWPMNLQLKTGRQNNSAENKRNQDKKVTGITTLFIPSEHFAFKKNKNKLDPFNILGFHRTIIKINSCSTES